jgi:hypothetical protein
MSKTEEIKDGIRMLFGKESANNTVYMIVALAVYYSAELEALGIPLWAVLIVLGVDINVVVNVLKGTINKLERERNRQNNIIAYMERGMSRKEAQNAADENEKSITQKLEEEVHTEIKKPDPQPFPQSTDTAGAKQPIVFDKGVKPNADD